MNDRMRPEKRISLSGDLLARAQKRADDLGLSVDKYIESLVAKDVQQGVHDPWRQPVPDEVSERWEQDIREFNEQEKRYPQKGAATAQEFMQMLDDVGTHEQVYRW